MLPLLNLDDQNFQEIFEEARKMIPGVYPTWTDYNEHDPGITFLELFSWLKEMQQYHLNQIGAEQLHMYLKLLGMKQLRRNPAHALVQFSEGKKDILLSKGSKLFAGDICFETTEKTYLEQIRILQCSSRRRTGEETIGEVMLEEAVLHSGSQFSFYMFGEQPQKGDEFLVKINHPFEPERLHSIYFELFEEYPIRRNRVSEEYFEPLAKLSLEYYYASSFHPCEVVKDETHQLIQSGKLYFKPAMHSQRHGGGYLLKLRIEECNYDVAPILQGIAVNVMEVEQKDTSSEYEEYIIHRNENKEYELLLDSYLALYGTIEVYMLTSFGYLPYDKYHVNIEENQLRLYLGDIFEGQEGEQLTLRIVCFQEEFGTSRSYETDGFPYQSLDLEEDEILFDSLALLVENELHPGYYEEWQKVDNFYCSTPVDCHYVFDEEQGQILFGNCEKGKAPEGNVVVIGYATTKGLGGNVKAKQITQIPSLEDIQVSNKDNAYDGCNKEALEGCFRRFMKDFRQVKRAITDEDYEELVKGTPGLMIHNVKTVPVSNMKKRDGSIDETCVTLVVKPYSSWKKATLNKAYTENISRYLDNKRLIGTKLQIISPQYIGVSIFGEIIVKAHYINAKEDVSIAIEEYFNIAGNVFGKPVLYSEIYGIIDALDCVSAVHNLSINSQGRGIQRSMNGDLILPSNGLVYLKEAQYFITSGD